MTNMKEQVMACINVMYGTLMKLYPLGAKSPTFNAKVNVMQRMMKLTSECRRYSIPPSEKKKN